MVKNAKKHNLVYSLRKKCLSFLSVLLMVATLFPATVMASTTVAIVTTPVALSESAINDLTDPASTTISVDITLTGNTWASFAKVEDTTPDDGIFNVDPLFIPTVKAAFSTTTQTDKWNALLDTATAYKILNSDKTLSITIPKPPAEAKYDIQAVQEIRFTPPTAMLEDSTPSAPAPVATFSIAADPQATLSGTLISSPVNELAIATGGRDLVITLLDRQWHANIATDATRRSTLFKALVPDIAIPADAAKWNTDVYNAFIAKPNPTDVITRNSNTQVTIKLPTVASFDISAPLKISLTNLDATLFDPAAALGNIVNDSFTINTNTVAWDPQPTLTESTIMTADNTIKLTLSNNTWADLPNDAAKRQTLINSFIASTEPDSWSKVKAAILSEGTFALDGAKKTLTLTIPDVASYSIAANQVITVQIPPTVLTNYSQEINELSFTIGANPSVAFSGTLTNGVDELSLIAGGTTFIATLSNTTWKALVTTDITLRESLIDALFPLLKASHYPSNTIKQSTIDKWAEARAAIKAGATFAIDNAKTVVTITLPSVPGFNIEENVVFEPDPTELSSLTNSASLDSSTVAAKYTISPVASQTVTLTGTILTAAEPDLVSGGKTLIITLDNDVWAQDIVNDEGKREQFIDSLLISTANSATTALKTALKSNATCIVRTSDKVLTITFPPISDFALTSDQTFDIRVTSPYLLTSSDPISAGSFNVKTVTATLSGTAVTTSIDNASVTTGGKTLILTLKNATWKPDVTTSSKLNDVLACIYTSQPPGNWATIKTSITTPNLTRTSNTVLTIKLPAVTNYTFNGTAEQLKLKINPTAFSRLIAESLSPDKNLEDTYTTVQIAQTLQSPISATIAGSVAGFKPLTVAEVLAGGEQITLTLTNGSWASNLLTNATTLKALVNGITSAVDTPSWALVQAELNKAGASAFRLTAPNVLTLTLPAVPGYDPIADQTIKLTLPKAALVPATYDVVAADQLKITLPPLNGTTSLSSMLDDGSFAEKINTIPLSKIRLTAPTKSLLSVISSQTTMGTTIMNSLDCYTDNSVDTVVVTVNGTAYTGNTFVLSGSGRKFNVGFATLTTATVVGDISIRVQAGGNPLQKDVVIKVSKGTKIFNFAPPANLSGSYTLLKLMSNTALLPNILKYYTPADLIVQTE